MGKLKMKKQKWRFREASRKACVLMLGLSMAVPCAAFPSVAAVRSVDTELVYKASGMEESSLRYAATRFVQIADDNSIVLEITKWAELAGGWGTDKNNPYAGKYLLNFYKPDFYKQIQSIEVKRGNKTVAMDKIADGNLWTLEINNANLSSGLIGVVSNHEVIIRLKDGKNLADIGMENDKIGFSSFWVKKNGAIAEESVSDGIIFEKEKEKEKENTFANGSMAMKALMDMDTKTLSTIHTFKPVENFKLTDYNWVIYVMEQIPSELLPYIDINNIYLGASDLKGKFKTKAPLKLEVSDNGLVDSRNTAAISIIHSNTKETLKSARDRLHDDVFPGVGGASQSYTIKYKIKDNVNIADFAKAITQYVKENDQQVIFEHWMEADYLDERDAGKETEVLEGSYANTYLNSNDSDKDGLFDFVEMQLGSDMNAVDTDGDGVPDGTEYLTDDTDMKNPRQYLVPVPTTDAPTLNPNQENVLTGKLPRIKHNNPADENNLLLVTNPNAGNVVVKLHKWDKDAGTPVNDQVLGQATISLTELDEGNFSITIPANSMTDKTEVVLVAYSPDGLKSSVGTPITVNGQKDAERYDPKPKEVTIKEGGTLNPKDGIENAQELPGNTKYTEETPAGTDKTKDYNATVKVEYPDGSSETVTVPVKVVQPDQPDKERLSRKYPPKAKDEVIQVGETVELDEHNIANWDDISDYVDAVYDETEDKDEILTDRPGRYRNRGKLRILYTDGSEKILKITIKVEGEEETATPSEATPSEATPSEAKGNDAKKYDPIPQDVIVKPGETLEPEEGIKNKEELPSDTEYKDVTPSNVDKTKDYEAIIKVVYPDGSSEKIKVPVTVSKGSRGTGGSWSGGSGGGGSSSRILNTSNDRIYADPDMSVSSGSVGGSWILVDGASNKWSYHTSTGALAKKGWMYISNPYAKDEYGKFSWFKFNEDGIMEYGWIKSQNGKWYHTHAISDGNLGVLHRGWYYEPMDGKWYYLDQKTGAMCEGWLLIDNQYYYFTEAANVLQQTYLQKEDGHWYYDNHNRRPYGSMYQDERTPDNYYVDANGVWKPES